MAQWQSRIVEQRQMSPAELTAHPRNWRKHPQPQADALGGALAEVGLVQGVVFNRRTKRLLDGHLRVKLAMENRQATLPVTVVDLSEEEELTVLATLDPIGAMAEADRATLDAILAELRVEDARLVEFLASQRGADGGGNGASVSVATPTLADRFLVPPFSVLDARQGYWQERKRHWIALGIKSEIGRLETTEHACFHEGRVLIERRMAGRGNNTGKNSAMNRLTGRLARDIDDSSPIVSIFDPVLCELAYRWFCPPGGRVLDPFAGGSVRGIVGAVLGREYVGIDLSARQIEANEEQADDIVASGTGACPRPRWVIGDSRCLDELVPGVEADFVFSCPPYGDLEVYSTDERDLSVMDGEGFRNAYRQIIAAAVSRLRSNRFACFVVGEYRLPSGGYADLVGSTVEAFEAAGAAYYNEAVLVTAIGSLPLRVANGFCSSRKLGKTHQNVLVFVKGDPKLATEACGPVEVTDIAEAAG